MKMRAARRKQVRRWDKVHMSWHAIIDSGYLFPMRGYRPCSEYTAWCVECNAALFPKIFGRFPRNLREFAEFEEAQRAEE